ncbi:MAG TPA: choice-of-anchor D domain-containing protein [Candidatus Acidoferrum sp.]|nr:choice-of-anchor D domain-containing protein [Candidatus Acidoferrum sp.]
MATGEKSKGSSKQFFAGRVGNTRGFVALLAAVITGAAAISGCAGIATNSNANPTPQEEVQISPSSLTFPNVSVGQQSTQSAVLTNTSSKTVSITQLAFSSAQFSATGLATPLMLSPGQSAKFQVSFRSSTTGTVSGTLSAMTAHGGGSTKVKLNGAAGKSASQLSLSTTSLKYGNVLVNGSATQAVTLKNSGTSDVNISQLGVSGSGFSVSGVAVPVTLPAGQSMALQATFAPATTGTSNGSVTITSDATAPSTAVALSGTGVSATYTMSLAPASLSFGNVNVGSSASQALQLSNTGNSSVTISQVAVAGAGISVSGFSSPVTLNPSQSIPLTVSFAPSVAGSISGSVTVTNSVGVNAVAAVTGTGAQGALSVSPATASFGSVITGKSSTQSIQLKNTGTASITVSQASVSGAGFSASGLSFPLTLAAGQSSSLNVQFAPASAGSVTGSVSVASNAPNSPSSVALSGSGVAATYSMSLAPASVSFGNVNIGSTATQIVQLTNTGNSSYTISQLAATGTGISVSGISSGATLAPAQTVPLTVSYAASAGAVSGSISVTSSQGVSASDAVTGTGVQGSLSVTPGSASFGSVVTGSTNTQTIQLSNTGTATLAISQATVTGSGFSLNGLSLPMNLAPGQTATFNAQYAPTAAGSVTGAISIVSNAPNSPATVGLSGTGIASTNTLSVNPASLSFGSVNDGSTASQSFNVTNTGNSNVAISGVTVTGAGYSILSGAGAVTLSPNQSAAVSIQFAPTTAGTLNGSVSVASNASGSPATVLLSGTGVSQPVNHSISLNWGASSSSVAGYNIYRSTVSGSSYSKLNGSPVGSTAYSDSSVQSGQTYYYVATAVDSTGNESVYSNEVPAIVP